MVIGIPSIENSTVKISYLIEFAMIGSFGPSTVAHLALPLQGPRSHMVCVPLLSFSPSSMLWPEKAIEDDPKPWTHAFTWESQKKLLSPSFVLAHL